MYTLIKTFLNIWNLLTMEYKFDTKIISQENQIKSFTLTFYKAITSDFWSCEN